MGNGDFNKPSGSSTKAGFLEEIRDMFATLAKMSGLASNPPNEHVRYNGTLKRFEKYSTTTGLWAILDLTGGGSFAAGTRMLFAQTAAPIGWTKETNAAYNDAALRVVTGNVTLGGTTGLSAIFGQSQAVNVSVTVNNHKLTISEIPAHGHTYYHFYNDLGQTPQSDLQFYISGQYGFRPLWNTPETNYTGGTGSHNHPASGSGSFTIPDLKYCDIIIATKD
jgi:hypothetical protein